MATDPAASSATALEENDKATVIAEDDEEATVIIAEDDENATVIEEATVIAEDDDNATRLAEDDEFTDARSVKSTPSEATQLEAGHKIIMSLPLKITKNSNLGKVCF